MTIKIENEKYYAVFNIETKTVDFPKTHKFVGIDLGIRTLATLDNGLKIANLDLTPEEAMIKKYQKRLSQQEYHCGYYYKDLKYQRKWKCPQCMTIHDRDINASKNILNQGLIDLINETMNLWDRGGDSTVILLSWESTGP